MNKSLALHPKCLNKSLASHPKCLNKSLALHPKWIAIIESYAWTIYLAGKAALIPSWWSITNKTIVALNQTQPSNRKAQFWILANQITKFKVSITPEIFIYMYFKIISIFFFFFCSWDIFVCRETSDFWKVHYIFNWREYVWLLVLVGSISRS